MNDAQLRSSTPSTLRLTMNGNCEHSSSLRRLETEHEWDGEKCEPLKYSEIEFVLRGWDVPETDPAQFDLFTHYLFDTPDRKKSLFFNKRKRALFRMSLTDYVRRHEAWTVNRGESFVNHTSARNSLSRRRKIVDGAIDVIKTRMASLLRNLDSKEQKNRLKEWRDKFRPILEGKLGGRLDDLISLDTLATVAKSRGRGYASMLVQLVTGIADAQGRGVWLFTNFHTTGFYARLGFVTIAEISLGESNPTWDEPPVVACMMLREPKSMRNAEWRNEKDEST
ncbi:hypothetical protein AcW2_001065 [Taiwanofungus camphoratus]|nr:hypothetical protein AcW2_001065 [Antrodia cinnamomea]